MLKKITLLIIIMVVAVVFGPGLRAQNVQLKYSTYLGGSDDDYANDIAVGSDRTVYITGTTNSANFPYRSGYDPSLTGNSDAFVTGLSSTGSSLVFSTYLGGNLSDEGGGIAIDSQGYIYVVGWTESGDFPTSLQPFQNVFGGGSGDGFITQFKPGGSSLYYSSFLGGSAGDGASSVSVGSDLSAYITGWTLSEDFPTRPNAFQPEFGGSVDGFVVKVLPNGASLAYSTYLGGNDEDDGEDIAVDMPGYAYITGYTKSTDFPTGGGAFQSSLAGGAGDFDAFVTQFQPNGSSLFYSTYLGGSQGDLGISIAVDTYSGIVYLAGDTISTDFPTRNCYQASRAGGGTLNEIFITKLFASGSSLYYSTYLGGSGNEFTGGITLATDGSAYLTGYTNSTDFPLLYPYQSSYGGGDYDAYVSRISSSGSALRYSTYLGGNGDDEGAGVAIDPDNNVYVCGETNSATGFPIRNPYQAALAGGTNYDGFVSKFSFSASPAEKDYHYDYNGDGTSDIAIFRGSSGLWAVRGVTRVYFGGASDQTAPGDYNGDGTTEIGIFRHTTGLWAIRGVTRAYFGTSYDWSEPGDYNGDGTWDLAIFRRTSGLWAVRSVTRVYFGGAYDTPSPGYFDGDNSLDFAIFRPNSGLWAARGVTRFYFGGSSDTATAGDYNGDDLWEGGIFRASSGLWAIRGVTRKYFGSGYTDTPVPADYNGDGRDDIGIFRYSSGLWAISGLTRAYYGSGDDPVAR